MTLDDFLKQERLTDAAFARLAGLGSRQLVHKYRRRERLPRPQQVQKIVTATRGAVTAADLRPDFAAAFAR